MGMGVLDKRGGRKRGRAGFWEGGEDGRCIGGWDGEEGEREGVIRKLSLVKFNCDHTLRWSIIYGNKPTFH